MSPGFSIPQRRVGGRRVGSERAIELETRSRADGDALGPTRDQVPPVGVEMKGTWHSWKDARWFLHGASRSFNSRNVCDLGVMNMRRKRRKQEASVEHPFQA
ncbi:hypothetical protein EYF80_066806 [Liparis tanakae]|uniref:Uncharacterized protein n=1 Tax=Liparis tanakae TaxID=230148 RepID=A0A4Z2E2V0_9TELE|nr:hypothetical protein EYF80_066806 [Liparis tanakae]